MGEENRCVRCGKPCAPNETMCEECKAWFQSQTKQTAGKVKLQKREVSSGPEAEKETKPLKEHPHFSKKSMIMIGVTAVAAVLIFVIVFALKGKKSTEQSGEPMHLAEEQNGNAPEQEKLQEDTSENEEKLWEYADADGTEGKSCVLYGTIEGRELKLDQRMSFYLNDEIGQKYFFKEAEYIALTDVPEELPLGKYYNHQVKVTGTLECAERVIYLSVQQMEATDGMIEEDISEEGIHSYEFVVKDCSWNEAFADCLSRGGYLVRINSQEEYDYILGEIVNRGMDSVHFYLGGRRDTEGTEYCWVDQNNQLYGEMLNSMESWGYAQWLAGEPSYEDPGIHIPEEYLNMFYLEREGRFVWADVPDDIPSVVPAFSGKVGYIVEYEE